MKSKNKRLICAFFALLFVISAPITVFARDTDQLSREIDGIFSFLWLRDGAADAQSWLDGALTAGAGNGTEWYVIALRQYFVGLDYTEYSNALEEKMLKNEVRGAVSRQRCALALAACGRGDSPAAALVADETPGAQGVMSLIFGLHILRAGVPSTLHDAGELTDKLLAARLGDGGWAVMGDRTNIDVTAMAIQSLAPYADEDPAVRAAIDSALAHLSAALTESGTYQSYGAENPESAAQAVMALTFLGIDPAADTRFMTPAGVSLIDGMLAFRAPGGGFCHTSGGEYNATATVQTLLALISVYRLAGGMSGIYIFDAPAPDTGTVTVPSSTAAGTAAPHTTAEATDTGISPEPQKSRTKVIVCVSIALAAAILCFIICFCGRKNKKSKKTALFVAAVAVAVIIFVALTRFSTPDGYYSHTDTRPTVGSVTISVRCDNAVGKSDAAPADGVILAAADMPLHEGDTVYDILIAAARQYGIQVDHSGTGSMVYISGIDYLYEFDLGELSGWTYLVNGTAPSVGCGAYAPGDGDRIEWVYTCALGADID